MKNCAVHSILCKIASYPHLSTENVDNSQVYPQKEKGCLKIIAESARIINKILKIRLKIIHKCITLSISYQNKSKKFRQGLDHAISILYNITL